MTDQRFSQLEILHKLLSNAQSFAQPLQSLIDQSGLSITVGTLVTGSVFGALLGFTLGGIATHAIASRIAGACLGGVLPLVYVRWRREVRRRRFEELFPEALEIIARSLRAGHAFATGLLMASEEVPDPVGPQLKLLYDSQTYGRPFDEAMRNFAEQAPILDARFFATAVLTQRETGGNLSEVLDNLVTVIRDRFRVKRQVRVLTAQGRFSGWVLAAAPPVLAVMLFFVNPNHILILLRDPIGVELLIGAAVLQILGVLVIRRIVNVEY